MPAPALVPVGPVVGFDLDMTLVDSARSIAVTLQAALAEVGVSVTHEQTWPYVGVPLELTLAAVAPGVDVAPVLERYRSLYPFIGIPSITLLPGAADAVGAVHELGGRVLVVSAKVERAVRAVLVHVGLDQGVLAPDVVAGDLFAQDKAGVLRAEGARVYVGDHPGDVAAARAAGALAVAVATGPHDAPALTAAGADVVLPDLTHFPRWLAGQGAAVQPANSGEPAASSG